MLHPFFNPFRLVLKLALLHRIAAAAAVEAVAAVECRCILKPPQPQYEGWKRKMVQPYLSGGPPPLKRKKSRGEEKGEELDLSSVEGTH